MLEASQIVPSSLFMQNQAVTPGSLVVFLEPTACHADHTKEGDFREGFWVKRP